MENLSNEEIISSLMLKASTKQQIYRTTLEAFNQLKKELVVVSEWMARRASAYDRQLKAKYSESGDFEAELKFASDTLVFIMHTNVFNFPDNHYIFKTNYVKQDLFRSYCGTILIYNFLSDSLKYNRFEDVGNLMARIFVNKENHFFIQGQHQYSFLFKDFTNLVVNKKNIKQIILTSLQQAIEFDLFVPPIETVNQITVGQKIQAQGIFALSTGKRLGFSSKTEDLDEY